MLGRPGGKSHPITTGIAIRASNVTVINPRVENCQRGIAIYRDIRGGVVQKVRIVADASLAGYKQTELRHNRESLYIERVKGGEFGDITSSQLGKDGGQLRVNDTYRFVHALGSQDFRIHDFTGDCSGGVASNWGSSAPAGMCHWGIKWLSDRPTGAPYMVSNNAVRDIDVSGVDDESISMDGRYDVPARSAVVGTDTVASRKPYTRRLELSSSGWSNLSENLTNQYVQIVSGPYQGEYVRITSRSGSTFTVDDAGTRARYIQRPPRAPELPVLELPRALPPIKPAKMPATVVNTVSKI
ncbi:MAG TPA: hypothetical protein VK869_02635 [Rubrobacteraceae bacterium]|nr:hypothetical protein [Rubrobacteraceae bacterium]